MFSAPPARCRTHACVLVTLGVFVAHVLAMIVARTAIGGGAGRPDEVYRTQGLHRRGWYQLDGV